MSNYKDYPHIYFKKKYIGLHFQGVTRGDIDFHFSGGKGIDGCIRQLNNINSVVGNLHIMNSYMCKILGIKTALYKDELEDQSNLGLLSLIGEKPKIDSSSIEEKIRKLEKTIASLEEKISDLSTDNINKILDIVNKIDDKV